MAQRYFFGNTLAAFFRSSTAVVEVTTAGRFDSSFVANALSTPNNGDYLETMPFIDAASTSTLWIHFEAFIPAVGAGGIVQYFNSSGVQVARLFSANTGTTVKLQYWNGTAFVDANGGATTTFSSNTLTRFDLKATAGAGGGLALFINGALAISDTGAGLNAAVTNFAKVRFIGTGTNTLFLSQILGADFDTRDSRYLCQLANGNGADTDGTGSYTDINETVLDESTSIALPTSGNKKTFTHSSITLPAGYMPGAVGVAGRGRINGTGPSDADFLIRSGGADYASTGLGLNTGYEPRGRLWTTDPNTGADWTQSGYNAAEFGLKAA